VTLRNLFIDLSKASLCSDKNGKDIHVSDLRVFLRSVFVKSFPLIQRHQIAPHTESITNERHAVRDGDDSKVRVRVRESEGERDSPKLFECSMNRMTESSECKD
jgi:hypothetical protein